MCDQKVKSRITLLPHDLQTHIWRHVYATVMQSLKYKTVPDSFNEAHIEAEIESARVKRQYYHKHRKQEEQWYKYKMGLKNGYILHVFVNRKVA